MSDSKQEQTSYEEYAQQYQDYYNYYYDSNGSHSNNTSNANYDYHDAQGSDAYNNDNKSDYQTDRADNRGYRSNYSSRYGSNNNNNNNSGSSYNNNRYNSNSNSNGIHRMEDTIYISNLPQDVTEEKLAEHFGSIGIIKTDKKLRKPKIWIYMDKATNLPKGDATITYDDPPSADAAINWFGGKEFMGNVIQVSKAERKMNKVVVVSAIEEEEEVEEAIVAVLPEMEIGPVKNAAQIISQEETSVSAVTNQDKERDMMTEEVVMTEEAMTEEAITEATVLIDVIVLIKKNKGKKCAYDAYTCAFNKKERQSTHENTTIVTLVSLMIHKAFGQIYVLLKNTLDLLCV
ncbi:hypothetical protein RMATCC62417_17851 [Rhizopus microsporus]|nr:hypothetical protein RMATCC62417_17851 [Rhizopus microsporus]CEG83994.1 hypothetical protein RMATCC62417_17851 [Rhizopus microsporus]